eukprot:gene18763-biopygen12977
MWVVARPRNPTVVPRPRMIPQPRIVAGAAGGGGIVGGARGVGPGSGGGQPSGVRGVGPGNGCSSTASRSCDRSRRCGRHPSRNTSLMSLGMGGGEASLSAWDPTPSAGSIIRGGAKRRLLWIRHPSS